MDIRNGICSREKNLKGEEEIGCTCKLIMLKALSSTIKIRSGFETQLTAWID